MYTRAWMINRVITYLSSDMNRIESGYENVPCKATRRLELSTLCTSIFISFMCIRKANWAKLRDCRSQFEMASGPTVFSDINLWQSFGHIKDIYDVHIRDRFLLLMCWVRVLCCAWPHIITGSMEWNVDYLNYTQKRFCNITVVLVVV